MSQFLPKPNEKKGGNLRIDFFLCYKKEGKAAVKLFFVWRNWPVNVPQKGYRITMAATKKKPDCHETKMTVTGQVVAVLQADGRESKVYMDMGKYTEDLRNGLMRIDYWTIVDLPAS